MLAYPRVRAVGCSRACCDAAGRPWHGTGQRVDPILLLDESHPCDLNLVVGLDGVEQSVQRVVPGLVTSELAEPVFGIFSTPHPSGDVA